MYEYIVEYRKEFDTLARTVYTSFLYKMQCSCKDMKYV